MKTFTRISSVLTLALAVCWGSLRAQETCETAVAVDCNSQTFGSTAGVANDTGTSGAGLCVTAVGTGGQQWYTFTAPADGSVIMSLVSANTTFDTKIHVYTGACGALDCVTGNDDFVGLQSQVTFDIVGGTTYLHSFDADDFIAINAATAVEVVSSINANPDIQFSARCAADRESNRLTRRNYDV